jgi:hypothetical protein
MAIVFITVSMTTQAIAQLLYTSFVTVRRRLGRKCVALCILDNNGLEGSRCLRRPFQRAFIISHKFLNALGG